jgi:riboflavin biosynthesis pyrimidine reductase
MQPLITLFERYSVPVETLPPVLASYYAGGLSIPEGSEAERPYVFANFVETIDGRISFGTSGPSGGGSISGENEQDKMVMGLLRARADAIIFGTASLAIDSNHERTAAFIYPPLAETYAEYRRQLGKREEHPLSVVVTASGQINLADRLFQTPGLRVLIATTERGYQHLSQFSLPPEATLHVIEGRDDEAAARVSPHGVLRVLAQEYGIRAALYEGGPNLFTSFLAERLINESANSRRLSLVEGQLFTPQQAPWAELLSVKQADNHLLLRYRLS